MSDNTILRLLESAARRRETLARVTDALRLVDGAGDGMDGLVLERYGRHFSAQVFDRRWLDKSDILTAFLKEHFGALYFIVKDRSGRASSEDFGKLLWLNEAPAAAVVRENGLNFSVDLDDALNCGLFLDMRRNRDIVSGYAAGRRVLNCFAYTCSFGVYCRARGARAAVNVDVSRKSLERGRANYRLNGLEPSRNEMIRADAAEYLKRAPGRRNSFGLVILDPPSFARHENGVFSVRRDMPGLVASAIKVLEPGGCLFVSTNLSGMTKSALTAMFKAGSAGRKFERLDSFGQDTDFTGSGTDRRGCLTTLLARF